jgi:hypothetical protein
LNNWQEVGGNFEELNVAVLGNHGYLAAGVDDGRV